MAYFKPDKFDPKKISKAILDGENEAFEQFKQCNEITEVYDSGRPFVFIAKNVNGFLGIVRTYSNGEIKFLLPCEFSFIGKFKNGSNVKSPGIALVKKAVGRNYFCGYCDSNGDYIGIYRDKNSGQYNCRFVDAQEFFGDSTRAFYYNERGRKEEEHLFRSDYYYEGKHISKFIPREQDI